MAGQVKLCFAFLLVFHVSLVSCRRDYHQYYSQYVKGESSTESSPSSTTGISTSKSADISISEVLYSENVISPKDNSYSSSDNDAYERNPTKTVIQSSSYNGYNEDDMRTILMIRWGLTIGGIVAVGLIVCCVAICCPCCCKGKERRGHIIATNAPAQPTAQLMQQQVPQAVAVQHYPPETQVPQYPPPYDTQPIQQQIHYPSSEHLLYENPMQPTGQQKLQQPLLPEGYSNPATAPPPYPTKY